MLTLDIESLVDTFGKGSPPELLAACQYWNPAITTIEAAYEFLWTIVWWLLQTGKLLEAARILWPTLLFDIRPRAVRRLFEELAKRDLVIIYGGAAQSKSYSCQAWCLLQFLVDPEYTSIRLMSTTGGHAHEHCYSSLRRFYEQSRLPMPGLARALYISMSTTDLHASLMVVPTSDGETRNLLQGWHPCRREVSHPVFGGDSRLRLFVDEGEEHPHSTFDGVENVKASMGDGRVKIVFGANPKKPTSSLGQLAEPPAGYGSLDIDESHEWDGRKGFYVVRLDPALSENIQEDREVYPSMLTPTAYKGYCQHQDLSYYAYGRGFPPPSMVEDAVVPRIWLSQMYGSIRFTAGTEVTIGGIDLAFSLKGDRPVFCVGRYGLAWGWSAEGSAQITRFDKPKYCVQIDQFRILEKHEGTIEMVNHIRHVGKQHGITDWSWVGIDGSGIGYGVANTFRSYGLDVKRIYWGEKAPHEKILKDDQHYADQLYDGIASAMYFSFAYLVQPTMDYIKVSPFITDRVELEKQLCGRQRKSSGRMGSTGIPLQRLEDKESYKRRMRESPDHADSAVMCAWTAIVNGPEKAQRVAARRPVKTNSPDLNYDSMKTIDFSKEN
jgi:hypothetical protein